MYLNSLPKWYRKNIPPQSNYSQLFIIVLTMLNPGPDKSCFENSVDPDQLASSQKPADLDPQRLSLWLKP